MLKHKIFSISLTVRDRAISSTPRVLKKYETTFQKISKMAAILNFRIFAKNVDTQIYAISLTVRDSDFVEIFDPRVSKKYTKPIFQKIFKNGGHFEFSHFRQKCKNAKYMLSP